MPNTNVNSLESCTRDIEEEHPYCSPVLNINGIVVAEGVAADNNIGQSCAHVYRRASHSPAVERKLVSQTKHELDFFVVWDENIYCDVRSAGCAHCFVHLK